MLSIIPLIKKIKNYNAEGFKGKLSTDTIRIIIRVILGFMVVFKVIAIVIASNYCRPRDKSTQFILIIFIPLYSIIFLIMKKSICKSNSSHNYVR